MEQPKSARLLLTPSQSSRDQRRLGHVMGHCDAHSAEHVDSLADFIDKVVLPFVVLVEQQMQLFERRPCRLPVVLLVQIHGA